jgi:hypothetical protein
MEYRKPREELRGPEGVKLRLELSLAVLVQLLEQEIESSERTRLLEQIATVKIALRSVRRKKERPTIYREHSELTARELLMAKLAKAPVRGRDVIYHGTRYLPSVLRCGKLVPGAEVGIFFSRSAEVAAYFASLLGDQEECRSPGVLVVDRQSLRRCYRLEPNRYDVFSGRNEREEVVWGRSINIRRHLLDVVSDQDVSKTLGLPKIRYLPPGFALWSARRRRNFNRIHRDTTVPEDRTLVRERIVAERNGKYN